MKIASCSALALVAMTLFSASAQAQSLANTNTTYDQCLEAAEGNNIKIGQVKLNGNIYTRARWIINNRHLWETLYSKGCIPNKSLVLKFPDIPQELKRHFIRGYFDGDGSVGIYNDKLSLSCLGTLDMLDNILKDFNWILKYHHDKRHTDKTYSFQLVSEKALEFLEYIYKDSSVYLERKYLISKFYHVP